MHNITWKLSETFDAGSSITKSKNGYYYIAMTDMIFVDTDGLQDYETFIMQIDSNINTFTCINFEQINDPGK